MIWVLDELLRINWKKLNDLVLHCLLVMGVWDWLKEEGGDLHQANRAIHYSTVVASQLVPRIPDTEAKVCHLQLGVLFPTNRCTYSMMNWTGRSILLISISIVQRP